MSAEITLSRFNKHTLIVLASSLALVGGLGLFAFNSGMIGSQPKTGYYNNYKPFYPTGDFAAALKYLPVDRDLASEKLAELKVNLSPAVDARRQYIIAQIAQRSGKFQEAQASYDAINISFVPYLADRVLLHRAEVAAELGQEKTVLDSTRQIIHRYGHSLSVPAAHYELGRSLLRQSKRTEAEREFNKIRGSYPDSQQAVGALYYLGQLSSNESARNELWSDYLLKSPDGRFSSEIIAEWKSNLNALTPKQKAAMGLALFEAGKRAESAQYLAADFGPKTWFPLAQAQMENKQKAAALNTVYEGLKRYPNSGEYLTAINYYLRNANASERDSLFSMLLASAPAEQLPYLVWQKSTYASGQKRRDILLSLEKQYPNSLWAGRASADIFWELYKSEDYSSAKEWGYSALSRYPSSQDMAKVRFWLAKRAEAEGDTIKAKSLYNQILTYNPASYYAFRAVGRLKALKGGVDPGWTLSTDSRQGFENWTWPLPQGEVNKLHPTLQELFHLNLWQEALSLMSEDFQKQYPALHAWLLARVENKVNEAIKVAGDELYRRKSSFSTDHDYWLISYPFLFANYSFSAAHKYGFDPLILQSLIRQESRFQHRVVSSAKAVGLCQLMPGTAKEVARSIGMPLPDFEDLCNPSFNIELGAKYLSGLLKQFNGQAQLAVAGYNAGPGSVSKWLKANPNQDPDLFVENIPFQETQKYVINVFENYWIYSNLVKSIQPSNRFGYAAPSASNSTLDKLSAEAGVDFVN